MTVQQDSSRQFSYRTFTVQVNKYTSQLEQNTPVHSSARACRQFNYIQELHSRSPVDRSANPVNCVATFGTPYNHQLKPVKILQKEVLSTQKQPGC